MGADTVSDPPIELKRSFAKRLAKVSAEKSVTKKATSLVSGFSLGDLSVTPPANAEPRTGLSMGQHCELMAKQWHIARSEQDQLAFRSHKRAAAAYDSGFLDDLVVPTAGVFRDNNCGPISSLRRSRSSSPPSTARRHADGGQLHAPHRRRVRGVARVGGMGGGAWAQAASLSDLRPALRHRLRGRGSTASSWRPPSRFRKCSTAPVLRFRISTSTRSTRLLPRRFCAR